jgi:hypothetical protein
MWMHQNLSMIQAGRKPGVEAVEAVEALQPLVPSYVPWSSRAQAKNLINWSAGREFQGNSIRMDIPVESDLSGRRALEHSCMSGSCHSVIGRLIWRSWLAGFQWIQQKPQASPAMWLISGVTSAHSQQGWGEAHWSSVRQSQRQLHHLKKSLIQMSSHMACFLVRWSNQGRFAGNGSLPGHFWISTNRMGMKSIELQDSKMFKSYTSFQDGKFNSRYHWKMGDEQNEVPIMPPDLGKWVCLQIVYP